MSTTNEHNASTAQTPIGYVSAVTMESLRLGNAVMAAILTRNDVSGVDRAIYAAPEVAQPAAQGERIESDNVFCALLMTYAVATVTNASGSNEDEFKRLIARINAWGASQGRAGQLSMSKTIETWGENQRKYGESRADAKLVAENRALEEKLLARDAALNWYRDEAAAIAKNLEVNPRAVLASVQVLALDAGTRAGKSLATPAPTAGEPSAEKGGAA